MGAQPGGTGSARTAGRWTGWDTVAGNTPVGAGSRALGRWLGVGRSVRNKGPRMRWEKGRGGDVTPNLQSQPMPDGLLVLDRHSHALQLGQKKWEKPRELRRLASPPHQAWPGGVGPEAWGVECQSLCLKFDISGVPEKAPFLPVKASTCRLPEDDPEPLPPTGRAPPGSWPGTSHPHPPGGHWSRSGGKGQGAVGWQRPAAGRGAGAGAPGLEGRQPKANLGPAPSGR